MLMQTHMEVTAPTQPTNGTNGDAAADAAECCTITALKN